MISDDVYSSYEGWVTHEYQSDWKDRYRPSKKEMVSRKWNMKERKMISQLLGLVLLADECNFANKLLVRQVRTLSFFNRSDAYAWRGAVLVWVSAGGFRRKGRLWKYAIRNP